MTTIARGTVLGGRYIVGERLGVGGMGEVYEAVQQGLGRKVAIKVLAPELGSSAEALERFRREAEAAAAIGHPNIVQVIDFVGDAGGSPLLVMEHLVGQSLTSLIAKEGKLAPERAAFIALQVLSALAAAHARGIIHRDVKPSNVFIVTTLAVPDFAKVLDFGIAKDSAQKALTQHGEVLGTSGYMAPEQARGEHLDARADVFAVGALLFHAVSGRRPRDEPGISAAGFTRPRPLREVAPWVDPELAAIVDRALGFDREARWPSAEAMARALSPIAVRSQDVHDTVRDAVKNLAATLVSADGGVATTVSSPPKKGFATTVDEPPKKGLAATVDEPPLPPMALATETAPATAPMAPLPHVISAPPPPLYPSYGPPTFPMRPPAKPFTSSPAFVVIGVLLVFVSFLGAALAFCVSELRHVDDERDAMLDLATACPSTAKCTPRKFDFGTVSVCEPLPRIAAGDVIVTSADKVYRVESVRTDGSVEARWAGTVRTYPEVILRSNIEARVCK